MQLNNFGRIAKKYWQEIPKHYPNFILDEFIIMPNHVHGILLIKHNDDNKTVGANNHSPFSGVAPFPLWANDYSPLQEQQKRMGTSKTIGSVVRGYKIGVTKWFRQNTNIYLVWQRNYWERIIRNKIELNNIRQYIKGNPSKWQDDNYYYV